MNDTWRFEEGGKEFSVRVPAVWQSNSATSLVTSAVAGAGICYLPETTLQQAIDNQSLQAILKPYCFSAIPTWLVYPSKRFLPLRVRAAMDHLITSVAAQQ
jgi:DNA-binding transcriptional LysR family regulator